MAGPTYNDCMVKGFANRHPGLSFIHSYPGGVYTPLFKKSNTATIRYAGMLLTPLIKPFTYTLQAAGEHQLYALLKAGPGAKLTDDKGADIPLKEGYFNPDQVDKAWAHTEEPTSP